AQPAQTRGQRLAIEVLHHEVRGASLVDPEVVDLDDAWILDRGGRTRLGEEPLDVLALRAALGLEDFDRRAAADQCVLAQVDGSHSSLPELADYPVGAEREPFAHYE